MRMQKLVASCAAFFVGSVPTSAFAHCPLCTAGAGILAVAAAYVGIKTTVVGIFVGAFALALGLWLAHYVKHRYVPYQKVLFALAVFLTTIVPVAPLIEEYGAWYVSLGGAYGTLFHNTYAVNLFLAGSLLGAAIVMLAPRASASITKIRGAQMPFQGMALTLGALVIASALVQVLA